jgi:hypothetical protein
VAQDAQRVAHEPALASVDLVALAGHLACGAEEDGVADGQRRRACTSGRLEMDADAAPLRARGEDQ